MKTSLFDGRTLTLLFILMLTTSSTVAGTLLVTTQSPILTFEGALPGPLPASEPLTLAVEDGNTSALLHLGDYSIEDVGQTRSLTRDNTSPGEWDAVLDAAQTTILGDSWFWLGSDPAFDSDGRHRFRLQDPLRTFRLQQIDVTTNRFLVWSDDGNNFRRATFNLRFTWLVPEPAALVLLLFVLPIGLIRHRSP